MDRRQFLNTLIRASCLSALPGLQHPLLAQSPFPGKFLLSLQLDGGVDITSFCDPKMNVPGEREINWWARQDETQSAGNLSYAPVADNQAFFQQFHRDMLVINGVDAQTNSHTVGVTHNWSGRNSAGFPTITSLYAGSSAPDMPMAYLNFGGFGNTSGIIRSTRIADVSQIKNIIFPNQDVYDENFSYRRSADWERIQQYHQQTMERLVDEAGVPAGSRNNRRYFQEALLRAEGLQEFGNMIPPLNEIQQHREVLASHTSSLHQQIQVSLLAFSAGVSVAADLYEGAFDTHSDNDVRQQALLSNTTDAIDYLWHTAEQMGLADRLVLLIGSDFGRTPHYNSEDGKDHWPIGSYIVMERNAGYTNRVMGATDEGHNALRVNTQDGTPDPINGVAILPSHVHLALRKHLGIHDNGVTDLFPFNNTEDFAFFA